MSTVSRLLVIVVCLTMAGCSINRATGTFDPGKEIVNADVFYVERFGPDERELHKKIADSISVRGYTVTYGLEGEAPDDA